VTPLLSCDGNYKSVLDIEFANSCIICDGNMFYVDCVEHLV